MNAIRAMVRNGRVETDEPLAMPDGTKLLITKSSENIEDDWDNSPEGIQAWLNWLDSLQPLVFTDEELANLKQDKLERRAWELSQADERDQRLLGLWK